MKIKGNNYVFIDSQNLNLAIQEQGWKLDFKKFRKYLEDKYDIRKAFIFIGYVAKNQRLYTNLQKYRYILIFKPTLTLPNQKVKGNVDAELVLHCMIEYCNYDRALIVTGDGDFYCLVEYLRGKDKLLKLLVPNVQRYSGLLKQAAPNNIDFMNNLKKRLELKINESQLHKDQPL